MSTLAFPKHDGSVKKKYYDAYYLSVMRSARAAGVNVELDRSSKVWCGGSLNAYSCELDGKQFIMDFSDLERCQLNPQQQTCTYFKWHYGRYRREHHEAPNIRPLCVLMDFDWEEFNRVRNGVTYKANGGIITNNQRPRAAATARRRKVQGVLRERYGGKVRTEFIMQRDWWQLHDNCLVAVHVPGARNDMLDRGQWELMGLGVCVVSPKINTVLSAGPLEHGEHYVQVKEDYSDLIDTIEWCREHREECVEIGRQARRFFDCVAPPQRYWQYVKDSVNDQG